MNTKTCKKCGWVYPAYTEANCCRFCKEPFTEGTCKICRKFCTNLIGDRGICPECYREQVNAYSRERSIRNYRAGIIKAEERFRAWIETLNDTKAHVLTEEEWMEACRYFDGCALCGSHDISTRGYFIRFEDGGRYNACNVIPMCEICATSLKRQPNPFIQMDPNLNRNLAVGRGLSLKNLNNTASYLQAKIEGALHEQ